MTLPSAETVANLVTGVTKTMFGMSFCLAGEAAAEGPWTDNAGWRTVVLPIPGAQPVSVAVASNPGGAVALGSAMFSCPPADVDQSMMDDSLREIANIVAGQIKNVMGLDQALGLPRMVESSDVSPSAWQGATLENNDTRVRVWVAITER